MPRNRNLNPAQLREWAAQATDAELRDFLRNGLIDLIEDLEQDDFFGTEGFNKRFA